MPLRGGASETRKRCVALQQVRSKAAVMRAAYRGGR